MLKLKPFRSALLGCAAVGILGACSGSSDVASPGVGAFVPAPTPTTPTPTTPTPTTPTPGTPAADCPAGFSNVGTVSNKRICQLPSTITGNLVVPARAGTVYSISGRTQVGTDQGPDPLNPLAGSAAGILTVEAGVTIFGNSGLDYLLVNRGSQIFAEGTQTNPVIMTSRQNVEGTATDTSIGQWGGLVIAGRGPTTDGCTTASVTPPNIACEAQVEGTNGFYGGNSTADNSGRIRFLRLSFSGFELAPGNELNGITLAGVGSGTTIDHVQVHNSSDDGIEIFGGNVNLKYLVLSGEDDDAFDLDSGWRGAAQFGIIYQRTGGGDRGFEASSRGTNTADFFSRPTYSNWTIVARSSATSGRALTFNSGHTGRVYNTVITAADGSTKQCVNLDGAVTLANASYGPAGSTTPTGPIFNSVFLSCPGGSYHGSGTLTDAQVQAQVEAGTNIVVGTSTLTGGFINGANETAVPASTFPTFLNTGVGLSGSTTTNFLTPVTYIGAVQNASDTWYAGWTCGIPGQPAC